MKVSSLIAIVLALATLIAVVSADAPAPAAAPAPTAAPAAAPTAAKPKPAGGKRKAQPPVTSTGAPAKPIAKKNTPGQNCSVFGKDCATCTDVHNCAWTKKGKCINTSEALYAKLKAKEAVFDACPKVVKLGPTIHIIPQQKRVADIVEPVVGATDTEPVIATADVVAQLPAGAAIPRGPNWSFIQGQQAPKKQPQAEGYLEPEWA